MKTFITIKQELLMVEIWKVHYYFWIYAKEEVLVGQKLWPGAFRCPEKKHSGGHEEKDTRASRVLRPRPGVQSRRRHPRHLLGCKDSSSSI